MRHRLIGKTKVARRVLFLIDFELICAKGFEESREDRKQLKLHIPPSAPFALPKNLIIIFKRISPFCGNK